MSSQTRPGTNPGGYRNRRRDIKERTMNRLAALDSDIASRYDYDDEEEDSRLRISQKSKMERQIESMTNAIRGRGNKMHRQAMRSAGGNRETIFRIVVRTEGRTDSDFIMQQLSELVEGILPFNISEDANKNTTFFVHTREESETVTQLSRRISHPSDPRFKFHIYSTSNPAPWESLDFKIKTAIRDVVRQRYNPSSNSVDLSNFQANKIFLERDLRSLCSLTRYAVIVEAIRAVAEFFPGITGLSLKNNRLAMLNYVQTFTYACPGVKELDLSDNNLDDIEELKKIRQWCIERLFLENNPLCSAFSDASSYTSAVHDYLPRVSYLDGSVVTCNPFKVKADIQRRSGVLHPPVQASYFPDADLKLRVEQLLVEYYGLYDKLPADKSRQMLVNAYDENATLTYAIHYLPDRSGYGGGQRTEADPAYGHYLKSSHNLVQEEKWARYREKIVYKGAMAIAVALSQLPASEHDKNTFVLEFITVRQQLLVFTLRGVLRDGVDAPGATNYKFFTRTFTVVPRGDQMAIMNDDLILTPFTPNRLERYREQLKKMLEIAPDDPKPGPSGISIRSNNNANPLAIANLSTNSNGSAPGPSGLQQMQPQPLQLMPAAAQPTQPTMTQPQPQQQQSSAVPYDRNDPAIQQAMVEEFSKQSGMKPEWSRKCLEDCAWDYEAAGNAFNQYRAQIPAEAFM